MAASAYDACVVGSGASGGAVAYALCRAGLKVLLLEKGRRHGPEDLCHDELLMTRRDFFVPAAVDEPRTVLRPGDSAARVSSDGWISCCVGGGTLHMSGYFFRLRQGDLHLLSRHGEVAGAKVADWPFPYAELVPFYEQVEAIIGVSGDSSNGPLEEGRGPYPLPPLLSHPAAGLIEAGARKLGLRAFPTPRAILSRPYAGRPACHYCGFCSGYGCEAGAKSDSQVSFLALAQATGRLTLLPESMVTRVFATAGRVKGVLYRGPAGVEKQVTAQRVVLCGSAIETARLLMLSELCQGSGELGKNLFFSTLRSGWARFALPSPFFPAEAAALPFLDRTIQDFYETQGLPHPKAGTLLFQLPSAGPILRAQRIAQVETGPPLFGTALRRALRRALVETATIEWEALGEFLPHAGCYMDLDPQVKDRYGLPVARLHLSTHPASTAAAELLRTRAQAVLEAAGAVEQGQWQDDGLYMVLQGGTARMGQSAATSVLDPSGQAHEVRGLYVADSSGFSSGGGAPFTLTIMANALRVASHIVRRGPPS